MSKIKIHVERDERGIFWASRLGFHHAYKTYEQALTKAQEMQVEAGGPEAVKIVDHVQEAGA